MQKAATVLDAIRKRNIPLKDMTTGEPVAGKLARRVREETNGKGPTCLGTSPVVDFTL